MIPGFSYSAAGKSGIPERPRGSFLGSSLWDSPSLLQRESIPKTNSATPLPSPSAPSRESKISPARVTEQGLAGCGQRESASVFASTAYFYVGRRKNGMNCLKNPMCMADFS